MEIVVISLGEWLLVNQKRGVVDGEARRPTLAAYTGCILNSELVGALLVTKVQYMGVIRYIYVHTTRRREQLIV